MESWGISCGHLPSTVQLGFEVIRFGLLEVDAIFSCTLKLPPFITLTFAINYIALVLVVILNLFFFFFRIRLRSPSAAHLIHFRTHGKLPKIGAENDDKDVEGSQLGGV